MGYDRSMSPSIPPPADALAEALELLAAGTWPRAHEIVQKDTSTLAAWLHGIVHILEGDLDNARGWYKRAERAFPGPEHVQDEIAAARRTLEARAGQPGSA
jgi:hypothetical protein